MIKEGKIVKVKAIVSAVPQEIYRAFTTRLGLCEWLCDAAQVDHNTGTFYLSWNNGKDVRGTFSRLAANEQVVMAWHDRSGYEISEVRVKIKPGGGEELEAQAGRTAIIIRHGLPKNASKKFRNEIRNFWNNSITNLSSVLENGQDLRITQRPLLGLSGLRALTAEDDGLPVTNGIFITGVIEGMGAHQAGLQPGDILTEFDEMPLKTVNDLRAAVQHHKAGDTAKITFYRGSEKQIGNLTLSSPKIPPLPNTLDALILYLEKNHTAALKALYQELKGVTRIEATFRPKPEDWNILEVLAHLLTGERAIHTWINGLATGKGTLDIPFYYANDLAMQAVMKACPTSHSLFATLKRLNKEIIELLRRLPSEMKTNKSVTWRLAVNLFSIPDHTQDHVKQIASLLEMARSTYNASDTPPL